MKVKRDFMKVRRYINHWKHNDYRNFIEWYIFWIAADKLLKTSVHE